MKTTPAANEKETESFLGALTAFEEMRTTKEILENLIDALIEAEPILRDLVRQPLQRANEKLRECEQLAEELDLGIAAAT